MCTLSTDYEKKRETARNLSMLNSAAATLIITITNICMKMKFISERNMVLLCYSSNMAAVSTLCKPGFYMIAENVESD